MSHTGLNDNKYGGFVDHGRKFTSECCNHSKITFTI